MFDRADIGLIVTDFGGCDFYKIRDVNPREGTLDGDLLGEDGRPTGTVRVLQQSDCTRAAYDLTHLARTGDLRPFVPDHPS